MDRQTVLRIMAIGFGLMVLLVLLVAYFGYQQSRSIQNNAQDLVREGLLNSERGATLEAQIEKESSQLLDELAWLLGACLILAVGGSIASIWVTNRAFQRMERQTDELNQVSWHLVDAHEKISQRFSHEMHDELGQALTGLKSMLKTTTGADLEAHRDELVGVLDQVMRDVRELSQLLRPVILDDFGLDAGIRWLVDRFRQRTGIQAEYSSDFQGRLGELTETHLFRIAQEALTNVARHSAATAAWVRLEVSHEKVTLTIEDNGSGMGDGLHTGRLGLVGIRARVRQLNGTLRLENRENGGLRVWAQVPFRQAEHVYEQEDSSRHS